MSLLLYMISAHPSQRGVKQVRRVVAANRVAAFGID